MGEKYGFNSEKYFFNEPEKFNIYIWENIQITKKMFEINHGGYEEKYGLIVKNTL